MNFTCNGNYLNYSVHQPKTEGNLRPMDIFLFKDVFILNGRMRVTINNFTLFNYSIDCCNWNRYRKSNVFLRIWTDSLQQSIDFKMSCPYRKGLMHVPERNGTALQDLLLYVPNFLKTKNLLNVYFDLRFSTKIGRRITPLLEINELWELSAVD